MRFLDIQLVNGGLTPGEADDPVQVGADYARIGCHRGSGIEPVQFFQRLCLDLFGHTCREYLLAQFKALTYGGVCFAQFFLNGLQLFAQEILSLALIDL